MGSVALASRDYRHRAGASVSLWGTIAVARSVRWLALWLLLFNVVAAGVLPGMANARQMSLSDFTDAMAVCTAGGMVVLDHGGQPAETAGDHSYVCAFCLPLTHVGAALHVPPAMPPSLLPSPSVLVWPDSQRPARGSLLTGSIAPRAPPALI